MEEKKNATVVDVAEAAGVSVATVSRVVNGNYPVRPATRARVEEAIRQLHYVPNVQARELNTKRSSTIGVVVPGLYNMFFAEVIDGIEEGVRSAGLSLLLNCAQNDPMQEMDCVRQLVTRNIAGLIIISPNTKDIDENFYGSIARRMPLVFINGYHRVPGVSYVANDEAGGTYKALTHLYENGHRDILFLCGEHSDSYTVKEEAYRNFCEEWELTPHIVNIGEGNSVETVQAAERALAKELEGKAPTAILCCNDLMASGALRAAEGRGLAVPRDISIIGFDNVLLSRLIDPPLTTVDQNMKKLGLAAALVLCKSIQGETPQDVELENTLVLRKTTAPAK